MGYTIRNVPPAVDAVLRRRAKEEGKSLDEVALEALVRGLGLSDAPLRQRDLTDVAGAWEPDPTADAVLAEQRWSDPVLWR